MPSCRGFFLSALLSSQGIGVCGRRLVSLVQKWRRLVSFRLSMRFDARPAVYEVICDLQIRKFA